MLLIKIAMFFLPIIFFTSCVSGGKAESANASKSQPSVSTLPSADGDSSLIGKNRIPPGGLDLPLAGCPIFSMGLSHLREVTEQIPIAFGNVKGTYPSYAAMFSWILARPFSEYKNQNRNFATVIESKDCGFTWTTQSDLVSPIQLTSSSANRIGDGVNHFVVTPDPNADWYSRGFVTNIQWDRWDRSRIFQVFPSSSKERWTYQATLNNQIPNSTIGDPNMNTPDNFYSPSTQVNSDDPEKSVNLYFGGWRGKAVATLPCLGPWGQPNGKEGPIEKDCKCPLYNPGSSSADACTGDKIFVATNRASVTGSSNKLDFRVYSQNGKFSSSGWNSEKFEPVIWAAKLNLTCQKADCPYSVFHTNDPTVVKLRDGRTVVFFTGATLPVVNGLSPNFTHVGISSDGKNFQKFSILKRKIYDNALPKFPFGMDYNQANGTVRAFYDKSRDLIFLVSIASPDHPQVDPNHPDAHKIFVYVVRGADPTSVIRSYRINDHQHTLGAIPGRNFQAQNFNDYLSGTTN